MALYNSTGTIGGVLETFTTNVTGDLFITFLMIVLIIFVIGMALRLPLEIQAMIVLPLGLVLMAYSGDFVAIGGVMLIYLGVIVGKNFFFTR